MVNDLIAVESDLTAQIIRVSDCYITQDDIERIDVDVQYTYKDKFIKQRTHALPLNNRDDVVTKLKSIIKLEKRDLLYSFKSYEKLYSMIGEQL